MTQIVIPSTNRTVAAEALKGALANAGIGDWIVPTDEDHYASHFGFAGAPLNAFDQSSTSDSLTVTIDTGEGYVGGAWLGKDTTTDVTLDSSTDNQEVAIGPRYLTSDGIRIDLVQNFTTDEDYTVIWEFWTDSAGVTDFENRRNIGKPNVPRSTVAETIPAHWTFDTGATIREQLTVEAEHSHLSLFETDTENEYAIGASNGHLNFNDTDGPGLMRIRDQDGFVETTEEGGGVGMVVTSGGQKLEIQVNGTDGEGILNLKTQ